MHHGLSDHPDPRPAESAALSNLREAHAHIAAYGQSLSLPSLADCTSLKDCLNRVRAAALATPRGWLRFTSARPAAWPEARWPTLRELDAASARPHAAPIPCIVFSFDHHTAAANSSALAAANLTPGVPVPPNGIVEADPVTGCATGMLHEQAAYAVWSAAPEPTPDDRRSHVRRAIESFSALGFSRVHDMLAPPWLGPLLAELDRESPLGVAVDLYVDAAQLDNAAHGRAAWESPRLRLAGGKVFADGTLNSRTALVLHEYAGTPSDYPRGRAMLTPSQLDDAIAAAARHGLHLAVHAIGDGAVRLALDAFERSARRGGPRLRSPPGSAITGRIEHAELIDEADTGRFADLGVVCSVQPCHLLTDIEILTRALPHRLHRVLPLRELIERGCRPGELLWFGSDAPIVRPDPQDSLLAATQRRRGDMPPSAAVAPDQAISAAQSLAAFGAGP